MMNHKNRIGTKGLAAILLAATALVPTAPVAAQERSREAREMRGSGDRGNWRAERQQRSEQRGQPRAEQQQRTPRTDWRAQRSTESRGDWRAQQRTQQRSVPPERAAAEVQRAWSGDRRDRDDRRARDWSERDRADRNWSQGTWGDRNRDRTDTRNWDRNRDGRTDRNWDRGRDDRDRDGRARDGRSWDRDRNGAVDRRYRDNRNYSYGQSRAWDRRWRDDRRYDWRGYRNAYRDSYRMPRYYSPYRGHSYTRFSIGVRLWPSYYDSGYWINDPWQYRLPQAYGSYRWVRYYDDALLVDMRSGEVVDVIHDIFW